MADMSQLGLPSAAPLSIQAMLINLGMGFVLAWVMRWHFVKFSTTLSNKAEFAKVFPFLILTTTLIITIVKSSLALSLGLVGALSIVRFRTPIKEPEELAYLFSAISIGLGLGADQTLPTIIASAVIFLAVAVFKGQYKKYTFRNLYLTMHWQDGDKGESNDAKRLEQLNAIIQKHSVQSDVRRFDSHPQGGEVIYCVNIQDSEQLGQIVNDVKQAYANMSVTFIDQDQVPSV